MLESVSSVMIHDTSQYVMALLQVFLINIILIFVVPAMIWKSRLANKSIKESVLFCAGTQISYIVNLVFVLGFLHINNRYTLILGLILEYVFIRKVILKEKVFTRTKTILINTGYLLRGRKSLMIIFNEIYSFFRNKFSEMRKSRIVLSIKDHPFQYAIVASFLVYNTYFISHKVMSDFSYQFSDIPVHTSWVYGIENGNIFLDGIYPFAMHCMMYCVHQFSGLMLRDVVLVYGLFQSVLTVLFIYILSERIFRWKYSSYVVLTLFSLLFNQIRYGASLPQESGIFAIYGMAYFLIASLDDPVPTYEKKGKKRVKLLSWNYVLLALYVGLVIAFHFYTAIAAIIVALCIVLSRINRFIKWNYFKTVFLAAVAGAVIAITPFIAYLAQGYQFQLSMAWALSVISGEEWQGTAEDSYLSTIDTGDETALDAEVNTEEEEKDTRPIFEQYSGMELVKTILSDMGTFIHSNGNLFKGFVAISAGVAVVIGIMAGFVIAFIPKISTYGRNYFAFAVVCALFLFMGCTMDWNITVIMEPARVSSFVQPIMMITMAALFDMLVLVVDIVHKLVFGMQGKTQLELVLTLAACGLLVFTIYNNNLAHSFFEGDREYYNEPDYLIKQIRKVNEPYTYSIVSPTDEYYAVIDRAYHVELSEFMAMVDGNRQTFKIPTKRVYFFIEKRTLHDFYNGSDLVNLDYAAEEFQYRASTQDYYYQRNILESKAFYWAQEYQKMYPNQMKVYFEDDLYICYELTQEINAPFRYEFDYLEAARAAVNPGM